MAAFEHNEDEEEEPEKSKNSVKVSTLASIESLTFPLVQEVVLLADYRCEMCQDRVAKIVSRLNGKMQSMEIMLMERKVILTFTGKYSKETQTHGMKKKPEVVAIYKNIVNKITNVKRLILPSSQSHT